LLQNFGFVPIILEKNKQRNENATKSYGCTECRIPSFFKCVCHLYSIICKERTAWLDVAILMEQKEFCPDLVWQAAVQFHEWAQMWTACTRLSTNETIGNMKTKKGIAVSSWNESVY
jgi:hypothetical protein